MNISEKIKQAKKPLFSFELLPPLRGHNIENIYNAIENLLEFEPAYVNITHHRDEVVYKEIGSGLLEKKILKKRPGTIALSAAIKYKYNVDVVPHLICAGFTKEETEYALIEMSFLGLSEVFVLRGDVQAGQKRFIPEHNGHNYAIELVRQVRNMNNGIYLDEDLQNSTKTNFCVGVAGYPEKHLEAPNLDIDIAHLKRKVDAGAEYIVTQMFYNNDNFFRFVDKCRSVGIDVPIIPGIKPISNKRDIELLPQTFNIDLPSELVKEINNAKDTKEVENLGIEYAIAQSKELINKGVIGIHYYTLGRAENIRRIVKEVY